MSLDVFIPEVLYPTVVAAAGFCAFAFYPLAVEALRGRYWRLFAMRAGMIAALSSFSAYMLWWIAWRVALRPEWMVSHWLLALIVCIMTAGLTISGSCLAHDRPYGWLTGPLLVLGTGFIFSLVRVNGGV